MAMDNTMTPGDSNLDADSTLGSDGSMFAPIPAWERGRKRRTFGRTSRPASRSAATDTVAAEPRSFGREADGDEDLTLRQDDAADAALAAGPAYAADTRARTSSSVAPIAIVAGIIALGGLAAAGWYATQPHDNGVAQLTPGTTSTTTTTTGPAAAPTAMASNQALPAGAPGTTTTQTTTHVSSDSPPATTTTTHASRSTVSHAAAARSSATARSVDEAGMNASATLPAAPQPYGGAATTTSRSPTVAPPAPSPAPVGSAPAPAEATPAPAAGGATTTAVNPPAPTTTPPQPPAAAPDTAAPPQG